MHPVLENVTNEIIERSRETRTAYLARIDAAAKKEPHRAELACGNLAHAFAACGAGEKKRFNRTSKSQYRHYLFL